ncbi:unnamed protein product [Moneuplotes crassus]|uniref:Uncharacterized protein n=1 Tax=Euplotes crassus TaxID=5936 RepID=A0AAD1XDJ0_EUPCR|nr:unnamed protein product [Moneuplotes crassus]
MKRFNMDVILSDAPLLYLLHQMRKSSGFFDFHQLSMKLKLLYCNCLTLGQDLEEFQHLGE